MATNNNNNNTKAKKQRRTRHTKHRDVKLSYIQGLGASRRVVLVNVDALVHDAMQRVHPCPYPGSRNGPVRDVDARGPGGSTLGYFLSLPYSKLPARIDRAE
jgi:hypothetical protein